MEQVCSLCLPIYPRFLNLFIVFSITLNHIIILNHVFWASCVFMLYCYHFSNLEFCVTSYVTYDKLVFHGVSTSERIMWGFLASFNMFGVYIYRDYLFLNLYTPACVQRNPAGRFLGTSWVTMEHSFCNICALNVGEGITHKPMFPWP